MVSVIHENPSSAQPRILIAGGNPIDVESLRACLNELDGSRAVAVGKSEALDKIESFRPDVVVLDTVDPSSSDTEFCRKLKGDPSTSKVRVLIVSSLNKLSYLEQIVAAGADDFLSKPVNRLEMLRRVKNLLALLT